MPEVQAHLGGRFAPELPDDWQERYGKIIADLPKGQTREYMQTLYDCVKVWWELPESVGKRGTATHPGSNTPVKLTHLDKEIAEALDEHIPWSEQLMVMDENFRKLENQAALRYGERMQAWALAVREHITRKHFPEPSAYERLCKMLKNFADLCGLLPAASVEQLRAEMDKREMCEEEIRQTLSAKTYGPIPRPERGADTTPVKDAAVHLFYIVNELNNEREPIFMGKLR